MAQFFSVKRGTLILQDPEANASIMSVEGLAVFSQIAMITNIRAERNQITQYIKTLDKLNFGYAWGEGPGTLIVSGIMFFTKNCAPSGDGPGAINKYYDDKNVYDYTKPIKIAIGAAIFNGYLESLVMEAESTLYNYGTFTLQFRTLPPK